MRAAVFSAPDLPLSVEQVEPRAPGPRDVVVEIRASGICHSDLLATQGVFSYFKPPLVLGHEGAGVVVEVGAAVERVKPGDTVIGNVVLGCGHCAYCLADEAHLCTALLSALDVARATRPDGTRLTAGWGLGTFAEVMTVDERSVVRVDSDLPYEQLALIGCSISTGVGAVLHTARVRAGATVAVLGCGGVGLAVVQGARLAGAARIVAIDPIESKRTAACGFGATDTLDPTDADVVAQVQALTGGRGVDVAFEVAGLAVTISQAYEMTRRGGMAVVVGQAAAGETVTFSAHALRSGGRSLVGCTYGSVQPRRDFQMLADLAAAGRLDLAGLISRRVALTEVNDAFGALERGEVLRTMIL